MVFKMKKLLDFFLKFYNLLPGSIYGLIAFGISILAHLFGVLLYPQYDMTTMTVSQLSNGYGGIFYRISLIFTGIIGVPFCIYLSNAFLNRNKLNYLRKLALYLSLIYCISLIMIGYFWGVNIIISYIHGSFAVVAWISGFIFVSLFGILMFNDVRFPKSLVYFSFVVAATFLTHLIILSPITQWIMTLSIMFWVWILSSFMLYKRI